MNCEENYYRNKMKITKFTAENVLSWKNHQHNFIQNGYLINME